MFFFRSLPRSIIIIIIIIIITNENRTKFSNRHPEKKAMTDHFRSRFALLILINLEKKRIPISVLISEQVKPIEI